MTKKALGGPRQELLCPRRVRAHLNGVGRGPSSETEWNTRSPTGRRVSRRRASNGTPRGPAASARGVADVAPGEELATRAAGRRSCSVQARRADHDRRRGDLVESTYTELSGGGLFSASGGPQHRVRHPRARHGLDRQRHRRTRRCVKRTARRFSFQYYMQARSPPLGADGCPSSGRDARFVGSARTARRTSPSRRTRRCARSRTSGSCGPPTQRDSLGVEGCARAADGRLRCRSRGRRCRRSTAPTSHPHQASSAARTHCGSRDVARPDPDRDRRRGRLTLERTEARRRGTTVRVVSMPFGSSSRRSRPTIATRCCRRK